MGRTEVDGIFAMATCWYSSVEVQCVVAAEVVEERYGEAAEEVGKLSWVRRMAAVVESPAVVVALAVDVPAVEAFSVGRVGMVTEVSASLAL
jgi:hypothetical protein